MRVMADVFVSTWEKTSHTFVLSSTVWSLTGQANSCSPPRRATSCGIDTSVRLVQENQGGRPPKEIAKESFFMLPPLSAIDNLSVCGVNEPEQISSAFRKSFRSNMAMMNEAMCEDSNWISMREQRTSASTMLWVVSSTEDEQFFIENKLNDPPHQTTRCGIHTSAQENRSEFRMEIAGESFLLLSPTRTCPRGRRTRACHRSLQCP